MPSHTIFNIRIYDNIGFFFLLHVHVFSDTAKEQEKNIYLYKQEYTSSNNADTVLI